MKNLTNYIIFHDQKSLDYFKELNPDISNEFVYIFVGEDKVFYSYGNNYSIINPYFAKNNIEHYPSLLTFTAWYLLSKNDICKTDYIGLFEYDVEFLSNPNDIELYKDTIYGSMARNLPDKNGLYLESVPQFAKLLTSKEIEIARKQPFWNATSNFIVHKEFLIKFVDWYMQFIPEILGLKKHSHFHERAINVFAANNGYKNEYIPMIKHYQLCSHGDNI